MANERLGCKHYPTLPKKHHAKGEIRMEKPQTGLIGFKPEAFIEMLLKLDGRAKGHEVEVEVRKCEGKERRQAG